MEKRLAGSTIRMHEFTECIEECVRAWIHGSWYLSLWFLGLVVLYADKCAPQHHFLVSKHSMMRYQRDERLH